MATNFYFNNFDSSSEQFLIEDLVIESIKIYGHDVIYLPREIVNRDFVFNEDGISKFEDNYMIEMYIKNVDGFEGEQDFLSKFGLEVRDQITFSVSIRRFTDQIAVNEISLRPNEGDLIFLPLTASFYEIKFVEHEAIYYQLGDLQIYDLKCELYEYSGEEFNTGSDLLDQIEDNTKINMIDYSLQTQDGFLIANETDGPIIREVYNINTLTQSNNDIYQAQSAGIIDFSEVDPFSEGTY
jgi:hypothetical protein